MLKEIGQISNSCWISASAGSGKTKNLIDRILALLLSGVKPSRILCLTYTNAAATEMLERLSDYFSRWNQLSDEEIINKINELGFNRYNIKKIKKLCEENSGPNWVKIQTIHSFAFKLLQKFPLETGLYAGTKLADDDLKKRLLKESEQFALSQKELQPYFQLLSQETSYPFDVLKDYEIVEVRKFLAMHPQFIDIKRHFIDILEIDENLLFINKELLHNELMNKSFGKDHAQNFSQLIEVLSSENAKKTDNEKAIYLKNSLENKNDDFIFAVLTRTLEPIKTLCTNSLKNQIEDRMRDLQQATVRYLSIKQKITSAELNISFFCIAKIIIDRFQWLKQQHQLLDFDDVILYATELLNNNFSWVNYKIDNEIEHVLVDESQDTNPQQWELIKQITSDFFEHEKSEKTIFIVGDEKQSIYSFQGANIIKYKQIHSYFHRKIIDCGQKFHEIGLNKSYRSDGKILSFVDSVFQNDFSNIKHHTVKDSNAGAVTIVDLFDNEKKQHESISKYIADLIENSINSGTYVKDKKRTAEPHNFMILFRHRDLNLINQIRNELFSRNIPVSDVDCLMLNEELIVQDLLALAKFALFPHDDLMCARVLKSPVIGMSEQDLMWACLKRQDRSLWSYVTDDTDLIQKYQFDLLTRCICLEKSCYDFFSQILVERLTDKFLTRLGDQCVEIIDEFLAICSKFEKDYSSDLASFIKWFENSEHPVKREILLNTNEVHLMTAHHSKGLQAPFVILADANYVPKGSNELLSDADENLFVFFKKDSIKFVDELNELLSRAEEQRHLESHRLLYVALTRAENYLYILGEKTGRKNSTESWYDKIEKASIINKFERIENLRLFGKIEYGNNLTQSESMTTLEKSPLPDWFYEKIPVSENADPSFEQTSPAKFGDAVHALLSQMHIFKNDITIVSRDILSPFALPKKDERKALELCSLTFQNFPNLFDSKSQAEITFMYRGEEFRLDKIAEIDGETWIVDFKTGAQQDPIPAEYQLQLKKYKTIFEKIKNTKTRAAILWIQSQTLIELT